MFPSFYLYLISASEMRDYFTTWWGTSIAFRFVIHFFKKIYSWSDFNLLNVGEMQKKRTEIWDLVYLCEACGNTFSIKLKLLWNKIALSLNSTEKLSFLLIYQLSKYVNVESTMKQHCSLMFIDVDIWFKMKMGPRHLYGFWNDVAFLTLT